MKKKQIIAVALIVSAIASVAVYRLIRKKMDEEDGSDEEYDTEDDEDDSGQKKSYPVEGYI